MEGYELRLKKKIDDLQHQWNTLNEKLNRLKKQRILETRVEEQLRLEKLIDDTKTQCDQVEEQLKDMENQLGKVGSDAEEVPGRNYDYGPLPLVKKKHYVSEFDNLLLEKSPELFMKLQEIREVVIPELENIPDSLYSQDAAGHARQVLRLVVRLYYYPALQLHFNANELFIMGTLCLVHDVGMMPIENRTDKWIYKNHCQYSYDYVMTLAEQKLLEPDMADKVARLSLIHNKAIGIAKSELKKYESPDIKMNLIYAMFKAADMLEIEQQPGEILRIAPDIVTANIADFDIDSDAQTITLIPAVTAKPEYFDQLSRALSEHFKEAKEEFNRVGLNYKVVAKSESLGHDHRFGHDKRTAPMPFLDKSNIHKIVDLLTPLMERENERRARLISALGIDSPLLRQLELTGAVEPFLVNMIKALVDYGEVAPGKQALWALLEVVREDVGVDRQAKIDALYPVINALGRNDDQGQFLRR